MNTFRLKAVRSSSLIAVFILIAEFSNAQTETTLAHVTGKWQMYRNTPLTVYALTSDQINKLSRKTISLDSGGCRLLMDTLCKPSYSFTKYNSAEYIERSFRSTTSKFHIKSDSLYEIKVEGNSISPYNQKEMRKVMYLIYDGKNILFVQDGVIFRFARESKKVIRSSN